MELDCLVGKKIEHIYMNEDYLRFDTDDGSFCFDVDGDCCSESVFYDFIGVKKLLENGKIISVEEIDLNPSDIIEKDGDQEDKKSYQESIECYGYRLITEHPEFGEQSSVFSFRNYSNGYYGGWMNKCEVVDVSPEIFDDLLETQAVND